MTNTEIDGFLDSYELNNSNGVSNRELALMTLSDEIDLSLRDIHIILLDDVKPDIYEDNLLECFTEFNDVSVANNIVNGIYETDLECLEAVVGCTSIDIASTLYLHVDLYSTDLGVIEELAQLVLDRHDVGSAM